MSKQEKEEMKKEIELILLRMFSAISIDRPENMDNIVSFCMKDVKEAADPDNWHDGDVAIAFRRFIEKCKAK